MSVGTGRASHWVSTLSAWAARAVARAAALGLAAALIATSPALTSVAEAEGGVLGWLFDDGGQPFSLAPSPEDAAPGAIEGDAERSAQGGEDTAALDPETRGGSETGGGETSAEQTRTESAETEATETQAAETEAATPPLAETVVSTPFMRLAQARQGGETIRIAIVGDSLARNLWEGMRSTFAPTENIEIIREARSATGLVRTDRFDWFREAERLARRGEIDVYIVMIGGNDRQDIRDGSERHARFTEGWYQAYGARAQRFGEIIASAGKPIYWVSLPVVRSNRMRRDYGRMNQLFEAAASSIGARWIDIFGEFRDASGAYTAYGPGLDGRQTRLRNPDGLHFSTPGAQLLANMVAQVIRRDLNRQDARLRDVPFPRMRPEPASLSEQ